MKPRPPLTPPPFLARCLLCSFVASGVRIGEPAEVLFLHHEAVHPDAISFGFATEVRRQPVLMQTAA